MRKVHFDALPLPERPPSVSSHHSSAFTYELPLRRAPVLFIICGLVIAVVIAAVVAFYLMTNASQSVQIFQLFNSTNLLLNLTLSGVDCLQKEEDCKMPNSSLVCEARGECKCGRCECGLPSEEGNFTGQYCECGLCPMSLNGTICSNRGVCECGVCQCDPRFVGEACEHEKDSRMLPEVGGAPSNAVVQENGRKMFRSEKMKGRAIRQDVN